MKKISALAGLVINRGKFGAINGETSISTAAILSTYDGLLKYFILFF